MRSKKELQSLLEASRKALQEAEYRAEKLKAEKDIVEHNATLILKENRILKNTIKQIELIAESNTYSNEKIALRKTKELASTANLN